jgi:hypothetical protein
VGDACEGDLTELVLNYTGEGCDATSTSQDPDKYDCDGDPGFAGNVRVLVTNGGNEVYADVSGVAVGDPIVATGDFANQTFITIFSSGGTVLQELDFHTSCSEPLGPGDQFGAMLVTGITSTNGGTVSLGAEVEYTYTITNNAAGPLVNVTVIDDTYGEVPGSPIPVIGPGETVVLTLTVQVTETTTNTVEVVGQQGNAACEAEASATVTVLDPPEDCCLNGKPRLLVLRYTGDDCSATSNPQEGAAECDDLGTLLEDVYIIANTDSNPHSGTTWFEGPVSLMGTFTLDAMSDGESHLSSNTYVHVFDAAGGNQLQFVKFHTSCSKPLFVGDQFGSVMVVDCVGEDEIVMDCNNNGTDDTVDILTGYSLDCNGNGVPDECDIADGTCEDSNTDGVPDECEIETCPWDCGTPADGQVDVLDILAALAQWGGPGSCDCSSPRDDEVNVGDFLAILAHWGVCP